MNLARDLADRIARAAPLEGIHPTAIPGMFCIRVSTSQAPALRNWKASFCVVVQGVKEIWLEGQVWRHTGPHTIVSPVDLPVTSRVVEVSEARPMLGIKLAFDAAALQEIAGDRPPGDDLPGRSLFMGPASDRLLEATGRLVDLLDRPADAAVLGPLVHREMLHHLLQGPDGAAICQLVRAGSVTQRIAQAVHQLSASLDRPLDVDALARTTGLSRAVFFRRFKEATAMSPGQYHKRLRLHEARRLMVEEDEGAERAAWRVGYRSPSQFSRDYARMFGEPPRRDARVLRAAEASIREV